LEEGDNDMTATVIEEATTEAVELLSIYSPRKPPRFAVAPSAELINPKSLIAEALAEAQTVLNVTAGTALDRKVSLLKRSSKKQLLINVAHFVTGSGFVALIALSLPDAVKWLGAGVSLVAGVTALTLPRDLGALEKEINQDVAAVSALAGEIAEVQLDLLDSRPTDAVFRRAKNTIAACKKVAKKYELDQLVGYAGYNVHRLLDKSALKRFEA
jgi:hypothetical protein